MGRGRLPLPLRRARDPVLAAHRRRLPRHTAVSAVILLDRHARHGRRVPALVLRHASARSAPCRGSSAPPAASSSSGASPCPRAVDRVARFLKYVVLVVFAAVDLAGRRARPAPLRPVGGVGAPHLRRPAHHLRDRPGRPRRLPRRARSSTTASSASTSAPPARCSGSCSPGSASSTSAATPTTCIDCGRCDKACMMNVEVATADVVTSSECISCNECVNVCPVPGALKVTAPAARASPRWRPPASWSRSWSPSSA